MKQDGNRNETQALRVIAPHPAGLLREAHLPPEPTRYAALGARASRSVPRARLISPSSVCTRANAATSIWPPPCPSPASRRRAARARLHAACHGRFPAAEAASGLQFRISRVVGLVNQLANQAKKRENDTRWQQKRKHALRITMLCHAQKLCEAHLPPEPTRYAALGASQAGGCDAPDSNLRPPYARDQKISQGFDRLAASSVPLVAAAPRMNMHLACHGPFAAAEAASGSPAATYALFSIFFN